MDGYDLDLDEAAFLRFAAQYFRIRLDAAFRAAADIPGRVFATPAPLDTIAGGLGGLAWRPAEPCSTSMALVSRSRSSINSLMICSVGIQDYCRPSVPRIQKARIHPTSAESILSEGGEELMIVTLLRPVVAAAKEGAVVIVTIPAGATVEFDYATGALTDVLWDGDTYLAMCEDLLEAARPATVES